MKIAIDVCIGKRGEALLRKAGHDVVIVADHAEPDREWFARAQAAGVELVIAIDSDLEILCYDNRVPFIRARSHLDGLSNAQRALDILASRIRGRHLKNTGSAKSQTRDMIGAMDTQTTQPIPPSRSSTVTSITSIDEIPVDPQEAGVIDIVAIGVTATGEERTFGASYCEDGQDGPKRRAQAYGAVFREVFRMSDQDRSDILSALHTARRQGQIPEARVAALTQLMERYR